MRCVIKDHIAPSVGCAQTQGWVAGCELNQTIDKDS